jgi:hypothetical protein
MIMQQFPIKPLYLKILTISTSAIAIVLVVHLFINGSSSRSRVDSTQNSIQHITAIKVPEVISFAGEEVPVAQYDVKESLERELLVNAYWHSQTILWIKRAPRFFPVIEPILKEQGVPDDLKFLCLIESNLMSRSLSSAGAAGFWQFMPETAKIYGLEVNKEVDERYNLEKATVAACRYLRGAKEKLGSWTLAAASYNAGLAGVSRQVEKQKESNYYNLLFGEETGRYIYRILAAKAIISEPSKYGFNIAKEEMYSSLETVTVEMKDGILDIADFAKKYGTTYKEVKNLNPWLRETSLTNATKKTYLIKLPASSKEMVDKQ